MFEELEELARLRIGREVDAAAKALLERERVIREDAGRRGLAPSSGVVVHARKEAALAFARLVCDAELSVWTDLIVAHRPRFDDDAAGFVLARIESRASKHAESAARWAREEGLPGGNAHVEVAMGAVVAEARRTLKERVLEDGLRGARVAASSAAAMVGGKPSGVNDESVFSAQVMRVMIAGPSDVAAEKQVVREVVADWNAAHGQAEGLMLLPVAWETDVTPQMGTRAQEAVNEQILRRSHLLVAIFWTRIGTPTGKAPSGTVEEIREHVDAGRPTMLYFSDAPRAPSATDATQWKALTEFRAWCMGTGLVAQHESIPEFRAKFTSHLARVLRQRTTPAPAPAQGLASLPATRRDVPPEPARSDSARLLLEAASQGRGGAVIAARHLGGISVSAGGTALYSGPDDRERAKWEAAVKELLGAGLLRTGGKDVYLLTDAGYRATEAPGG